MANRKLSDHLKVLRGTDQPCRMGNEAVKFEPLDEVPDCPEYLNEHSRAYWVRILPILQERDCVSVADLESVEMMCLLYGKIRKAVDGEVDINSSMVTQLRLYQTEFGLTHASRQKIGKSGDGKKANSFGKNGKKPTRAN